MPLTIQNYVLSYKQKIYFSENRFVLPRNYFHMKQNSQVAIFATYIFKRWQMGFSGGILATCNC